MVLRGSDDVTVLRVAGRWSQVVDGLHREMLQELALEPRAVVGDLSAARGTVVPALLGRLASLGALARDWPGCAIALTSPDPEVRAELRRQPMGSYVYVAPTPPEAVAAIGREPAPSCAVLQLAPQCTASRAARDFVTRTCLDWRMAAAIPPACLVISEFVTNGVLHAGTNLEVRLAGLNGLLHVSVRDGQSERPRLGRPDEERLGGRGLALVERLTRAWGCLPTADGGKVVWAVIGVGAEAHG